MPCGTPTVSERQSVRNSALKVKSDVHALPLLATNLTTRMCDAYNIGQFS
jgi:hypothetical protein